jgi:nitroreductase
MELFETIKNRRSIRHYKTDPVDDEKINAILEAGRWAPSWANTQCWRFIVIRAPEVKAKLAGTLISVFKSADKAAPNPGTAALNTAPVVIAICAETGTSGGKINPEGGRIEYITDKGDWFMFDTALAVQNMVLAAHALGLGTVIMGAFDAAKAEKALNVPKGYRIVTFFPVGVADRAGKAPPRKELSAIVIKDKWG